MMIRFIPFFEKQMLYYLCEWMNLVGIAERKVSCLFRLAWLLIENKKP